MAVNMDFECSKCGDVVLDKLSTHEGKKHNRSCSGKLKWLPTFTDRIAPGTHPSERVVVYESAQERKIQYPGRNDVPVPERLVKRGYIRRELNVRDLARFERQHNVANERRHFDRNGKGL